MSDTAAEAARRIAAGPEAAKQLQEHQQQLDMDGVIVGVSREALDIVLCAYLCQATRIEELEKALRALADAADDVGVKYFDTDTMDPLVGEMQAATLVARAALLDPTP